MEEGKDGHGDELSFTSPNFNPLSALYSNLVTVPYPTATTYDNVSVFESSFKTTDSKPTATKVKGQVKSSARDSTASTQSSVTGHPVIARETVPSSLAKDRKEAILRMGIKTTTEQPKPTKVRKTVWNRLKAGYEHGPLSLLTRCVNDKLVVNVRTRNRREIRGCCRGYIVAFDKHMNLAMVDVDETYRNPLWRSKSARRRQRKTQHCQQQSIEQSDKEIQEGEAGGEVRVQGSEEEDLDSVSAQTDTRLKHLTIDQRQTREETPTSNPPCGPKELTRHVNQLFVRGDTVVTVIPIK